MVLHDVLTQGRLVGGKHALRPELALDLRSGVATGMKQQLRARRDADVAYREENRACGLAVAVDAKALPRGIVLPHDCVEDRPLATVRAHADGNPAGFAQVRDRALGPSRRGGACT